MFLKGIWGLLLHRIPMIYITRMFPMIHASLRAIVVCRTIMVVRADDTDGGGEQDAGRQIYHYQFHGYLLG